ncbi:MAG TPA: FadR/GntR family transcriptional regulator [Solirubrobacteraceae bacterium]
MTTPLTLAHLSQGPPKASELVAEDLRAHILGNALPEGAPLPSEAELIARLGVSRATVREGLRLLSADGLIAVKRGPRGGIEVRHPNAAHISRSLATTVTLEGVSLDELFDFRLVIEPAAARTAAKRPKTEEEARLLLDAAKEPDAAVTERVDFHVLVAELSGNKLLHIVLAALHDVLEIHVESESLTPEDVRQTGRAHERIARAIVDGDAERAEAAMRRHLQRFRDRMREAGRLEGPVIPQSSWLRRPSRQFVLG